MTNSNSARVAELSRRKFLYSAASGSATIALAHAKPAAAAPAKRRRKICLFTKQLQALSFDELADRVAELGFDGIEAPIRPGGHVEPARVEADLPKLVEALKSRGLEITIMASGVNSLEQPHTKTVLRTAADLGVQKYRMAYSRYDLDQPVAAQLKALRPIVDELVAFSRELGITPIYQNHSGSTIVGAPIWDVYSLMKHHAIDDIGFALDLGHATIEGGLSWPVQVNLVRPRVKALYVKDFIWNGDQVQWVPLGEGQTDRQFYRQLSTSGFDGPLSVHVEYLPDGDKQNTAKYLTAFRRDLATLKSWVTE